jgi:hypothetical protein
MAALSRVAVLLRQFDRMLPKDSRVSHLSGTRQDQGMVVRNPALRLQVSASPIDFAFHPRFVALEKRDIVAADQKIGGFQFAVGSPLQCSRSFCEPAKRNIVDSKSLIAKREVDGHGLRFGTVRVVERASHEYWDLESGEIVRGYVGLAGHHLLACFFAIAQGGSTIQVPLKMDSDLDPLRGNPRFKAIQKKLQFPEL